jgi:hypothetical protein
MGVVGPIIMLATAGHMKEELMRIIPEDRRCRRRRIVVVNVITPF